MKNPLPCPDEPPPICESVYRCFCVRYGFWDELSQLCPEHNQPQIKVRIMPTRDEAQR